MPHSPAIARHRRAVSTMDDMRNMEADTFLPPLASPFSPPAFNPYDIILGSNEAIAGLDSPAPYTGGNHKAEQSRDMAFSWLEDKMGDLKVGSQILPSQDMGMMQQQVFQFPSVSQTVIQDNSQMRSKSEEQERIREENEHKHKEERRRMEEEENKRKEEERKLQEEMFRQQEALRKQYQQQQKIKEQEYQRQQKLLQEQRQMQLAREQQQQMMLQQQMARQQREKEMERKNLQKIMKHRQEQ